jgi:hypothetical protein
VTTRRIPGAFLAIPVLALSLAACSSGGDLPIGNTQTWASVRVANLAPDIPALDFCFALQGTGNWIGPQMKAMGETGGIAYGNPARQVGKYAGLIATAWDVRIVVPNAADCSAPITPDGAMVVGTNGWYTVAVTGLATSTSAPHAIYTWSDDDVAPPGQVKLRFVNAAMASATAPSPPLDGGTGSPTGLPTPFRPVFPSVLFPGPASPSTTVDANGYATFAPADLVPGTTVFTACLSGAAPGPVTCPVTQTYGGPPLPALYVGTTFAVGGGPSPYRFLTCVDNVPSQVTNFCTCL